ncbi:hypothetical protein EYF80_052746 [Liparis tanakae]|uniref:Uncharacterized protein n=1 Tax=Liparis tanakae TaxID=230148 RepID=A0A4Z2F8F0_9TELE|nr:hypothetical protein EYF80_052746 [Liparis tanakae]
MAAKKHAKIPAKPKVGVSVPFRGPLEPLRRAQSAGPGPLAISGLPWPFIRLRPGGYSPPLEDSYRAGRGAPLRYSARHEQHVLPAARVRGEHPGALGTPPPFRRSRSPQCSRDSETTTGTGTGSPSARYRGPCCASAVRTWLRVSPWRLVGNTVSSRCPRGPYGAYGGEEPGGPRAGATGCCTARYCCSFRRRNSCSFNVEELLLLQEE